MNKKCSFCGRSKENCQHLIEAESQSYICDFCVKASIDLIKRSKEDEKIIAFKDDTINLSGDVA